jgi:hypothetical protein
VDAAIVADVAGADLASTMDTLQPAVVARVLRPADMGAYRFEHDLFRETAYADQDPATRARTHLAVARALGARRDGGGEARAGDIAHHWARAVPAADPVEAMTNVAMAARDATARLAHEEAARQATSRSASAWRSCSSSIGNDRAARRSHWVRPSCGGSTAARQSRSAVNCAAHASADARSGK